MAARVLLPGEYAVLGLLRLRPMHGYEMSRHFDDDLVDVFPMEQSSLYTYLRNVEGRGLVSWEEHRVGQRPPRKIYRLEPAGLAAVDAWLRRPVERIREVRLDFLLKLYFLHESDPAAAGQLVEEQVAVVRRYLQSVEAQQPRDSFHALVLGSRRSAARATLEWLSAYGADLGSSLAAGETA